MKITNVKIRIVNDESILKAVATLTFDDELVVHDVKVLRSDKGLFISMPSRKTPGGQYKDIAHPVNQETRDYIVSQVLAAYEQELSNKE